MCVWEEYKKKLEPYLGSNFKRPCAVPFHSPWSKSATILAMPAGIPDIIIRSWCVCTVPSAAPCIKHELDVHFMISQVVEKCKNHISKRLQTHLIQWQYINNVHPVAFGSIGGNASDDILHLGDWIPNRQRQSNKRLSEAFEIHIDLETPRT